MQLKTFTTHTFAVGTTIKSIALSFNVWASENKDINIIRTDYFINKRVNENKQEYEELTLLVFYEENLTP